MKNYSSLGSEILKNRLSEFINSSDIGKLESQINKLSKFVCHYLNIYSENGFNLIYDQLKLKKTVLFYSQCVSNLRSTDHSYFYHVHDRTEYSLIKEAREWVKTYKQKGNFDGAFAESG